jgi:hypothetical protein
MVWASRHRRSALTPASSYASLSSTCASLISVGELTLAETSTKVSVAFTVSGGTTQRDHGATGFRRQLHSQAARREAAGVGLSQTLTTGRCIHGLRGGGRKDEVSSTMGHYAVNMISIIILHLAHTISSAEAGWAGVRQEMEPSCGRWRWGMKPGSGSVPVHHPHHRHQRYGVRISVVL